ncbi:MAG: sugar nucleotide-binding protein [Clostridiaceae bacterium]
MEKILLTGGKGFFCSRLAAYYKNQYEFLITDKDQLDITDEAAVMKTVIEFNPDIIIHAGAVAVTEFCDRNPEVAHKINVDAAVYVARAAKSVGSKLVFISTEQVFNGNTNDGPFTEEDEAVPNTVYGANKLEAEGLLKEILNELWIVRFTWMFGVPERNCNMSSGILWDTMTNIMKNKKISASKREFRGMTYVYEMIENFSKLFKAPFGTYHLGAENDMNRYEIVKEIFMELGLENRIEELLTEDTVKYQDNNRDVRLNTNKAKKFDMEFSDTNEAIKKCIQEFRLKLV